MKQKKDAKYLNVNIKSPIYDELEAFSNHTGVSKTAATEQGLRMYMDDFYRRTEGLKDKVMSSMNDNSE